MLRACVCARSSSSRCSRTSSACDCSYAARYSAPCASSAARWFFSSLTCACSARTPASSSARRASTARSTAARTCSSTTREMSGWFAAHDEGCECCGSYAAAAAAAACCATLKMPPVNASPPFAATVRSTAARSCARPDTLDAAGARRELSRITHRPPPTPPTRSRYDRSASGALVTLANFSKAAESAASLSSPTPAPSPLSCTVAAVAASSCSSASASSKRSPCVKTATAWRQKASPKSAASASSALRASSVKRSARKTSSTACTPPGASATTRPISPITSACVFVVSKRPTVSVTASAPSWDAADAETSVTDDAERPHRNALRRRSRLPQDDLPCPVGPTSTTVRVARARSLCSCR
mmetsp:Transcript_18725/g.58201  ORF Transcript_18725/g.58201 Transcript_18725/m.58201 type:complete len:358 (+) Transcript_18725:171-1244(+)